MGRRTAVLVGSILLAAGSFAPAAAQAAPETPCGEAPAGANVIVSNAATILGTDGDDYICAGDGTNQIFGFAGDDQIFGMGGDDWIEGGDGDDWIDAGTEADVVHGGDGHDYIDGGRHPDWINGNAGNDTIYGGGGRDKIRGEKGRDIIHGEQGRDRIWGGAGADVIRGGKTADVVRGNQGDDTIAGDHGIDRVFAGPGVDKCSADREFECEELISDIGIKTIDRDTIAPATKVGERVKNTGYFTPDSTVTIYHWASPQKETLLGSLTIATDRFGQFRYFHNAKFPMGSYLEVSDDGTGQHVGLEITFDIAHFGEWPPDYPGVHSVGAWMEATTPPDSTIWQDNGGRTRGSAADPGWALLTDESGEYRGSTHNWQTEHYRVHFSLTQGRGAIETYSLQTSPADFWISQYAVGAEAGPWTPDGEIEVRRNGVLVDGAVPTDYRGRFSFGFATELEPGTTIAATDRKTGHTETVVYEAEFEFQQFTGTRAIATGHLWVGSDARTAEGFVVDRRGRVRVGLWSHGSHPPRWTYGIGDNVGDIYVLAIRSINDDNHEIYYFF